MTNLSNIEYYTTAVTIGDLKNSMLYFDNIIPAALPIDFLKELVKRDMSGLSEILKKVGDEIFPKDLIVNREFANDLANLNVSAYHMMSKELIRFHKLEPKIPGVSDFQYKKIEKTFADDYFDFIYKYNLENFPLLSASRNAIASLPEDNINPLPAILTLSNLKIIDVSNAPWEQIIEFRKDSTTKAKLRKLRLFAYQNYEGKSKNYIEDDLNNKIYDYEFSAKKFGLEMLQATVNNVINSKLFTGVVGGSLLSTFFAEPTTSLLTVSAGLVIELGQLTLEFKRQKYELQNLIKDNPVSYITYLKEKQETKNKCL